MFSGLCHEHTRATLDTNGFTAILRNRGVVRQTESSGIQANLYHFDMYFPAQMAQNFAINVSVFPTGFPKVAQ